MTNAPERPDAGMPCTGCGECCREKICKFGMIAFPGAEAPCPALLWERERYWCLLVKVEASEPVEKSMAESLGIGRGCSKNINLKLCRPDSPEDILKMVLFINGLATE